MSISTVIMRGYGSGATAPVVLRGYMAGVLSTVNTIFPGGATVVREGEIFLNGVRLSIIGGVRRTLISQFPEKQVFGDVGRESHPQTSLVSLTSWPGGIGRERYADVQGEKRCWYSTCNVKQTTLGLQNLTVETASPGVTGTTKLGEYYESSMMWVYGAFGTAVRKYTETTDSWGSTLHTLPADPTNVLTFRMAGTLYLAFATTGGFTWYNGSVWTDDIGQDTKLLAWHDDSLWGMDANGTLWNLTALAVKQAESGTVSGTEADGSADLDDSGAVFDATIRDGTYWVRVTDAGGDSVTGWIGTVDVDADSTRVNIFNSAALTTQNWVEGGATAFDMADTPLTYNIYKKVITKAQLPLPDGWATELFTGRAASNEIVLYCMTKSGLWVYDQTNDKWIGTEVDPPLHPRSSEGSVKWRDSLAIAAGLSVYQYQTGSGVAALGLIGPDLDDGLPAILGGNITQLAGSHNDLLALIDGKQTITKSTVTYSPGIPGTGDTGAAFPSLDAAVSGELTSTGYAAVLGWDGSNTHWNVKWQSSASGTPAQDLLVSTAYDKYRAWWAWDGKMFYQELPTNIVNVSQIDSNAFALTGKHEYPWFDGDDEDSIKTGLAFVGMAESMSTDEIGVLSYALDYDESVVTIAGTINSNGRFYLPLPTPGIPEGVPFRAIRAYWELSRGATNTTNSPQIRTLDLSYQKRLAAKYGYEVTIPMIGGYNERTDLDIRRAIDDAINSDVLLQFNYHDETQGQVTKWVNVRLAPSIDRTGQEYGDAIDLFLLEA